MIGSLEHIGLMMRYNYAGNGQYGWSAKTTFIDGGFASDDASENRVSTEGELRTRYYVTDSNGVSGARAAAQTLLNDLKRLGIEPASSGHILYIYNGEDQEMDIDSPAYEEIPKKDLEELELFAEKNRLSFQH